MLCLEEYCYFLDYMQIAYFLTTNRPTHFPAYFNQNIDDLSAFDDVTARDMTVLSVVQLSKMYAHLCIPGVLSYQERHGFTGKG